MSRGPLSQDSYRPQFSGHETFPLRYGWVKKVFDAINDSKNVRENKSIFLNDDAIARFGVGKNMVASMRHWASATGLIEEGSERQSIRVTSLARKILDDSGLDPYMENPSTLWLIHWQLAGRPEKTTWFWSFNHFHSTNFDREHLEQGLNKLVADRGWPRVSRTTIKRDVDCFVRTYVMRLAPSGHEDALESPLTELGLIKRIGRRDGFRFSRGPKSSLNSGIFLYALTKFWDQYSSARTLSFEAIAHAPGSPGRVFLLDENDLAERLLEIDEVSAGIFRWSETAGLKQVIRDTELSDHMALQFVDNDFRNGKKRKGA